MTLRGQLIYGSIRKGEIVLWSLETVFLLLLVLIGLSHGGEPPRSIYWSTLRTCPFGWEPSSPTPGTSSTVKPPSQLNCYHFGSQNFQRFWEAQAYCQNLQSGSQLVWITNLDENNLIRGHGPPRWSYYWIGYMSLSPDSEAWNDPSHPLDRKSFRNFVPGLGCLRALCPRALMNDHGKWQRVPEDYALGAKPLCKLVLKSSGGVGGLQGSFSKLVLTISLTLILTHLISV